MYLWLIPVDMAETSTILLNNYPSIKNKKSMGLKVNSKKRKHTNTTDKGIEQIFLGPHTKGQEAT